MVRQAQQYFAAAVSAAILNAAAVAAFVALTILSGVQAFPLQDLLGSGGAVVPSTSAPATGGAGSAAPSDAFLRGAGVTRSSGSQATDTTPAAATAASGPDLGPEDTAPAAPPSGPVGTPGPGSPGPGAGPQPPAVPGLPAAPPAAPEPPPTVQQLGGAVADAPPALSQGVNDTAAAADTLFGGGLSQTGARQAVEATTDALVGPQSAVGQATGGIGAALQGQGQAD